MKVATSYFYQIRNFAPYEIPLSTAVWDPKWFHDNNGPNYVWQDRRSVVNGLRILPLVPNSSCNGLCRGPEHCAFQPSECAFLKQYKHQLDCIDFEDFMDKLRRHIDKVCNMYNIFDEPTAVFVFHEKYDNPCSERVAVQQWFREHNVEIYELIE